MLNPVGWENWKPPVEAEGWAGAAGMTAGAGDAPALPPKAKNPLLLGVPKLLVAPNWNPPAAKR